MIRIHAWPVDRASPESRQISNQPLSKHRNNPHQTEMEGKIRGRLSESFL